MTVKVPYRSAGGARDMMQRTLTTVGTRDAGRLPFFFRDDPRRTIQPVTRGFSDLCCGGCAPGVSYEAAKRQRLGALGAAPVVGYAKQAYTGVATGSAVASAATAAGVSIASAVGAGAAAGSVVPVLGTAIGALVGLLASGVFNHKVDPEVGNFNQAVALYHQNPQSVINIANKYLVLAGLFDLQPGQIKGNIPIYKRYGRMGEQRFVTDLATRIYQAAQSGQITASDTPNSVFNRIVQPWIDSWGYGPMVDANADMIKLVIVGMTAEYLAGLQTRWYAVGGDYPFGNLPRFALPAPVAPTPIAAPSVVALSPPIQAAPLCAAPYQWNGTQCVLPGSTGATTPGTAAAASQCVAPYLWNGTQCVLPANASLTPVASMTPNQGATLPPGFTAVATDPSGNPIFASPQGVLYSWLNGNMQLYSGQIAGGSSPAAQMQAALQNSLAQGQSQAQAAAAALNQAQTAGVAVTPQLQQAVAEQTSATAAAPLQTTAAGIGGALSGMTGAIAIGATLLAVAFATARPVGKPTRGRRG